VCPSATASPSFARTRLRVRGHPGPPGPASSGALGPRRPQPRRRRPRRRPAGPHHAGAAPGRRLAAGRPQPGQPLRRGQVEPDPSSGAGTLRAVVDADGVAPDPAVMRDLPAAASRAHHCPRFAWEQPHPAGRQLAGLQRRPVKQITRHVKPSRSVLADVPRLPRAPSGDRGRRAARRAAQRRARSCLARPAAANVRARRPQPRTHIFSCQEPMPASDNRRQPVALILEQKLALSTAARVTTCFRTKSAIALELKPAGSGGK